MKRSKKWRVNRKAQRVPLTDKERELEDLWARYLESEIRVTEQTRKAWKQLLGMGFLAGVEESMEKEARNAEETMQWAKENGVLEHPIFHEGRDIVIPVKTGRNRP